MPNKLNKSPQMNTIRASVSFSPDIYHTLEKIAEQKKVSLAWVVRAAAEMYIAEQSSLYENKMQSRVE